MTEQDKAEVKEIVDTAIQTAFAHAIPQIIQQTVAQTVEQVQGMWRDVSAGLRGAETRISSVINDALVRVDVLEEGGGVCENRFKSLFRRVRRIELQLKLKPIE